MFKILDGVCTPKRGTKYSAYVDLFAREEVTIEAGETKIVKLGVKLDMDYLRQNFANPISGTIMPFRGLREDDFIDFLKSHFLEIALRSSLGVKGLIIANGSGKVDLDYPDEIGLIVHNPVIDVTFGVYNGSRFIINKGDKVAQCTLKEHKGYLLGYESDVVRVSGFGSTGI